MKQRLTTLFNRLKSNTEFIDFSRFIVAGVQWLSFCYVVDRYFLHLSITHGPSMMPTLDEMGNIILVDRFSSSRLGWSPIARGDIVVASSSYKRDFIICKRVIALPGDTVHIAPPPSQRHLFDFDHEIPRGILPRYYDENEEDDEENTSSFHNGDTTTNNDTFSISNGILIGKKGSNFQKVVIPPGHVWLEGDNPHDSVDSRYYGPVPGALIRGRAIARVWPLSSARWLDKDSCPKPTSNTIFRDAMLNDKEIIEDIKKNLISRRTFLSDELNKSFLMAKFLTEKEHRKNNYNKQFTYIGQLSQEKKSIS
jgi:mitochondrial inner membrane protease subunit 1